MSQLLLFETKEPRKNTGEPRFLASGVFLREGYNPGTPETPVTPEEGRGSPEVVPGPAVVPPPKPGARTTPETSSNPTNSLDNETPWKSQSQSPCEAKNTPPSETSRTSTVTAIRPTTSSGKQPAQTALRASRSPPLNELLHPDADATRAKRRAGRSENLLDQRHRLENEIERAEAEFAVANAEQAPFSDAFNIADQQLRALHAQRATVPVSRTDIFAAYDRRVLAGHAWHPSRTKAHELALWLNALRKDLSAVNKEIGV